MMTAAAYVHSTRVCILFGVLNVWYTTENITACTFIKIVCMCVARKIGNYNNCNNTTNERRINEQQNLLYPAARFWLSAYTEHFGLQVWSLQLLSSTTSSSSVYLRSVFMYFYIFFMAPSIIGPNSHYTLHCIATVSCLCACVCVHWEYCKNEYARYSTTTTTTINDDGHACCPILF